jgi:hypothetical protein
MSSDPHDQSGETAADGGTATAADEARADDDTGETRTENRGLSDRAAFWVSGVLALIISVGSVWLIGVQAVHFEALNRVRPTSEGGGVGAGWVEGNTLPALDWMITLVHFADVIAGVGILVVLFIHWIAFRRLAARMRPPGAPHRTSETVATDGGETDSSEKRGERASRANDDTAGGELR